MTDASKLIRKRKKKKMARLVAHQRTYKGKEEIIGRDRRKQEAYEGEQHSTKQQLVKVIIPAIQPLAEDIVSFTWP